MLKISNNISTKNINLLPLKNFLAKNSFCIFIPQSLNTKNTKVIHSFLLFLCIFFLLVFNTLSILSILDTLPAHILKGVQEARNDFFRVRNDLGIKVVY